MASLNFSALAKGKHVKWTASAPPGLQVEIVYEVTENTGKAIKVCPLPVGPVRVATVVAANKIGDAAIVDVSTVQSQKAPSKAETAIRDAAGGAGGEAAKAIVEKGKGGGGGAASVTAATELVSKKAKPKTVADKEASILENLEKEVSSSFFPSTEPATKTAFLIIHGVNRVVRSTCSPSLCFVLADAGACGY